MADAIIVNFLLFKSPPKGKETMLILAINSVSCIIPTFFPFEALKLTTRKTAVTERLSLTRIMPLLTINECLRHRSKTCREHASWHSKIRGYAFLRSKTRLKTHICRQRGSHCCRGYLLVSRQMTPALSSGVGNWVNSRPSHRLPYTSGNSGDNMPLTFIWYLGR